MALLAVHATAWAEAPTADLLWTAARVADASDRAYEATAAAGLLGERVLV